jgi:hypothetical protein
VVASGCEWLQIVAICFECLRVLARGCDLLPFVAIFLSGDEWLRVITMCCKCLRVVGSVCKLLLTFASGC